MGGCQDLTKCFCALFEVGAAVRFSNRHESVDIAPSRNSLQVGKRTKGGTLDEDGSGLRAFGVWRDRFWHRSKHARLALILLDPFGSFDLLGWDLYWLHVGSLESVFLRKRLDTGYGNSSCVVARAKASLTGCPPFRFEPLRVAVSMDTPA